MSEENDLNIKAQEMLRQFGISTEEGDVAVIPSEGMDFGSGSIVAPWTAQVCYWFLTDTDYVIHNRDSEPDGKVATPDIYRQKGDSGWYDMYYGDYATALDAYYKLHPDAKDSGFKPKPYWVFTAPTASVLNSRDLAKMVEGFGDTLVFTARVMALRTGSGRYPLKERHEYGLMSLPGAVAAAADAFGFANAGFDLAEFTAPEAKGNMDDEFFVKFCGNTEGGYQDAVLYQRRATLWKSLGEDNPKASAIVGAKTASGKPNKEATTSPKLSACLSLASGKWTVPIYARLALVPNPMAADNGEHYGLPVLVEIYSNEAQARAAAKEELGSEGNGGNGQGEASHPPTAGWGSAKPAEIVAYLRENGIIPLPEGTVAPPDRARLATDSFLKDYELLVQWDAYAKENG